MELESYKIPINKYENDMVTGLAKKKRNEILDLLTNHNRLHSKEEFDEIKGLLHISIQKCDLELIKIYLSERIENCSKSLVFKIDKINHTASLFKINNLTNELIPRTIEYESTEYLITSICGTCETINEIKFVEDSKVKTIYRNVFPNFSNIKEVYFPTSLKELKEGWCINAKNLTKIIISPSNGQFKFIDDKYLIGKSDHNNDEFDNLLFASRDIKEISIPSNIKIISSYAFANSRELTKVEIPSNSNLQTIGSSAFLKTNIKEIYFPTSLKELKEGWCINADNLTKIMISPSNDQFKFIDDKYLIGKSDPNNDEFDNLLFASRDIKEISIPSNIKIISSYAFANSKNLTTVEFETNSNLQTIGSNAFSSTNIKEIFIPSKVSKICKSTFFNCEKLTKVEIPSNSNLQTIESNAFFKTNIKEIYFPTSLKELKKGWCFDVNNLNKIIISPSNGQFKFIDNKYLIGKSDPNNDEFDNLLFASRDIKEISIPSNIKIISSYAFDRCQNLTKVDIPPNSNLQIIESDSFSFSTIKEIFIPSKVSKIGQNAFGFCNNLAKVEIAPDSNLQTIGYNSFSSTNIKEIFIPSTVSKISKFAFNLCDNLTKVEFEANSNLQTIGERAFSSTNIKEIFIPSKVS